MSVRQLARAGIDSMIGRAHGSWATRRSGNPDALFVVGPPRSGTTFAYQTLVAVLDVSYLSNLSNQFPTGPGFAAIANRLSSRPTSGQSDLGETKGLLAPSEAHRFWYRFFDRDLPDEGLVTSLETPKMQQLNRDLLLAASGRPIVLKNTYNSLRALAIGEAVPNAVFLVVRRDPADTARSLIRARLRLGSVNDWFSLPVPGRLGGAQRPPGEQVVDQIMFTYHALAAAEEQLGRDRFVDLSYERMCIDPRAEVDRVRQAVAESGVALDWTGLAAPAVSPGSDSPLEEAFESQIRGRLQEWNEGSVDL